MFTHSNSGIDHHIQTLQKRNFSYQLAIAEKTSLIEEYNAPIKPTEEIWCGVYLKGELVQVETKSKLESSIKKNEIRLNVLNKIKNNELITQEEHKHLMAIPALAKDFQISGYKNIVTQEEKTFPGLYLKK